MKKIRKSLAFLVIGILCLFFFGTSAGAAEKIRLAYVNWPGVTVKTEVAAQILKQMGYEVDQKALAVPVIFKSLSTGDLDVFAGAWLPTMKSISEKYFQDGSVVPVAINLDETVYTLAVPQYVWDAGVKSHADLNRFADRFGKKIIGIEPGNDGNQVVLDMIKNNSYDLKDWKLIESSSEAMMITVGSAFKKEEWVVWLGWSPHWMNLAYNVKYLEDPLKIWGSEPEVVKTVARAGLKKDNPEVYKFFRQFRVTPEIQNQWIEKFSREKQKAADVALEWIAANQGIVDQWVYGIKAADGSRGRDAVRRALKK